MTRFASLFFASALSFSQAHAGDEITYKGMPLGSSFHEFSMLFEDHECSGNACIFVLENCIFGKRSRRLPAAPNQSTDCRKRNSFGGTYPEAIISSFRDGKLVSISFTTWLTSFEILTAAATEKLGPPSKIVESTLQTRSGATFQNLTHYWEKASFVLKVDKYGTKIDRGSALLISRDELDRSENEKATRKRDGAKDF